MKKLRLLDLAPAIIWGMQNPKIRRATHWRVWYRRRIWQAGIDETVPSWEPSLIDSAGDRILSVLADPDRAERINAAAERHVR